ncbi:hypothetical protein C8Q80DRAFT_1344446 [Daedaleopsis nitida]|nr:hypothetical protein C8Q80DRAFT_1344446 [Daedaleopsis nitida]
MARSQQDNQSTPREVNNLLHTLRGEQFRHSQNLRRSKAHLAAIASRTFNDPSLPFSNIYKHANVQPRDRSHSVGVPPPHLIIREGQLEYDYPRGPVPGPPVPSSWSGLFKREPVDERNSIAFRKRALSILLSCMPSSFASNDVPDLTIPGLESRSIPVSGPSSMTSLLEGSDMLDGDPLHQSIPTLRQICLKTLLDLFPDTANFRDELLPILPQFFYRDVLRYTAVHDPLPNAKLYALCEPSGHVDGELIVVGPQATLQRDVLFSMSPAVPSRRAAGSGPEDRGEGPSSHRGREDSPELEEEGDPETEMGREKEEEEDSWDAGSSASQDEPPALHTLVVLNAVVPATMPFIFPPTITRLALLALPTPTQIHRLPRTCPLLRVLDLSYNVWLTEKSDGQGGPRETILDRIEWEKWARLRVLGLRECNAPQSVVVQVNRARFEAEVLVIGVDEQTFDASLDAVDGMMKSLRLSD